MAPEPPSPSASSVLLPFLGARPRRGSITSLSSKKDEIDKDVLQQALDSIHTSASKSETLTSFHDYDGGAPRSGAKEIVSSGISGLYDKYIRGVSGGIPGKESKTRPKSSGSKRSAETASIQSNGSQKAKRVSLRSHKADIASVTSHATLTASPQTNERSASTAKAEVRPTELKSGAERGDADDTEDEHPLTIITSISNKQDASESKRTRSAQSPPTRDDRNRAWDALADHDRSDSAAQALARVLSHHEMPVPDRPNLPRSLKDNDAIENAKDDSKLDQATLRSPSAAPATVTNNRITFEDPAPFQDTELVRTDSLRPPLARFGVSHLPGYDPSRTSSTDGGDNPSRNGSQTGLSRHIDLDPSPNLNAALQRSRAGDHASTYSAKPLEHVPSHLKRRVISKAFWMKDENAKDCFYCGQAFSAFRRKHHCRTCGQIFDAKCTSLVPGRPFGQPGTLRLCKPCEAMIYGSDDDSTVFSDDASDFRRTPISRRGTASNSERFDPMDGINDEDGDVAEVATPSIGIPASRRNREAKRRSAVIEFDAAPPLPRPISSHSLISLARRPRSSSHRRQYSRHQNLRGFRTPADARVPFQPDGQDDYERDSTLPAFHKDNVIDPDLAAFMSDDGSDEDDQPNILSAMTDVGTASPGHRERMGLGPFGSAMKKGRSRLGPASTTKPGKEDDALNQATKHLPKPSRNRNASFGSMSMNQCSPRRSRSNLLLKQAMESEQLDRRPDSPLTVQAGAATKLVRSCAMRGRDAPPIELNRASLEHVRKLLTQMLEDSGIESKRAWVKALTPILLQCTDDVEPNVQVGDDMDIRHYIKLKKVPGGRPGDTSYVSGVVFTKNIALKSMARCISNPRIAIVTFAIEYARHNSHFMSLEPVIAQEQEYLRNLVGRISALRPNVLLVQRNVSGSALNLLEKAGIAVAYNIKESVLAAVARVTQTSMIKSVDKLAINPAHLGTCDSFEVKTYMYEGVRKSYVYLSGCQPDLGCTVVLRGSDTKTLRKIKRVTEFMCYVAYNLKLETNLLRDEFISIPATAPGQLKAHESSDQLKIDDLDPVDHSTARAKSKYEKLEMESRTRILSASPFVVFMQPYLLTRLRDSERRLAAYRKLRDQYAAADEQGDNDEKSSEDHFQLVKPEMIHAPASKHQPKAMRDYLHAVHEAQLEKTMHTYDTQKRLMDSIMGGNISPFDPLSHQTIVVLQSTVSSINSAPCVGPELLGIGFYAGLNRVQPEFEEDCTLGQYVEDHCLSANTACKECGKKMYDHHRQYVHGYGQLSISVQRQPAKMRGYQKTILMWATCRICKAETTVIPMSDNTWKYSFAKYLELSFWSSPLHPRAGVCQHDIHKDFLRCFGFEELVVCVQYDPIDIYDIVVPRTTITWKVESDLKVKNNQYSRLVARLNAFTDSVTTRLDSINVDTLDEKKSMEAHNLLDELRKRAQDDHQELLQKLQRKYADSRYYELLPLNRALRFMDEKAIAWDDTFSDFERDYFPSETDIRKLATLQLRNMFLESQPSPSTIVSDASDDDESPERQPAGPTPLGRGLTDSALHSNKTHDLLSSTVEEHRTSIAEGEDVSDIIGDRREDSNESGLTRRVSPREEHEQAVQREDVKHLDLAVVVSSSPGDHLFEERRSSDEQSKQATSRPNTSEGQSTEEPFATQSKTVGSGLMERIEQIRNTRLTGAADVEVTESKIPRLADLQKRDVSPKPSPPPMMRAQSSPSSPRHIQRGSEHSIDSVANGSHIEDHNSPEKRLGDRLGVSRLASKVGKVAPSLIPRSIVKDPEDTHHTRVSALAKHFEQMSREFEKERLRERRQRALRSRHARANPLASSRPVVEVYRNATDAVGERSAEYPKVAQESTEAPVEHQRPTDESEEDQLVDSDEIRPGYTDSRQLEPNDAKQDNVRSETDGEGDAEGIDSDAPPTGSRHVSDPVPEVISSGLASPDSAMEMELVPEISITEHKKNVWFKYLAEFWSKRTSSGWTSLAYPLRTTEHVFEDSDIIVREDEPSSVIALSLACADYQTKVQEFRSHPKKQTKPSAPITPQPSDAFEETQHQAAVEASLLSDTGTHMKYSFAHGPVKASCKIFYAEAFDALRRRCGVADRFVESLSRCLKFDSKGGKTKSLFLKTHDNRFYIKSLQEVELKAFTKFAPDYFAFMSHTLFHGVPSVIAKMFGLFQVIIKNPATGVDFSYYLLVMENLFYERNPNRRFDLKGSMRNRKIESTGQPDEVLLDENLVETIFESPLFVREHAHKLLQASVWNDTMWLCKQNVMDYSLMAGFDDERKELVVGIIDCIRTYTWDKKLESWIKDRGKNKPTITSPKDYRNRFRVSMMQYVLLSPNCWHQVQTQMPLPKTLREREEGGEGAEEAT